MVTTAGNFELLGPWGFTICSRVSRRLSLPLPLRACAQVALAVHTMTPFRSLHVTTACDVAAINSSGTSSSNIDHILTVRGHAVIVFTAWTSTAERNSQQCGRELQVPERPNRAPQCSARAGSMNTCFGVEGCTGEAGDRRATLRCRTNASLIAHLDIWDFSTDAS